MPLKMHPDSARDCANNPAHPTPDEREASPVASQQYTYKNGGSMPHTDYSPNDVPWYAIEWTGKKILAIAGILFAGGYLTFPATKWQVDAVAAQVKTQNERLEKIESAMVQNLVWQAKFDEKIGGVSDKIDDLFAAPAAPTPPPHRRVFAKKPPQRKGLF